MVASGETAVAELINAALHGETKSERQSAEKQFEKLVKEDKVSGDDVNLLCMRLFGQENAEEADAASEDDASDEGDSEEEEEADDSFEQPMVVDQSVLAGHNEDIVLDDLGESSFSLLQVLMEDEELVSSKKSKTEKKQEEQEHRTEQMRALRLLDAALSRSKTAPVYQTPQLVADLGCSLLAFALDSSDEEVTQKLILTLDSHWRKFASPAVSPAGGLVVDGAELLQTVTTDVLPLIVNHRSLTPSAVAVVARVLGKILEFIPDQTAAQNLLQSQLLLWAQNKIFRRSQGAPFFRAFEAASCRWNLEIWTEAVSQCSKLFRLKELVDLLPWKSLALGDYQTGVQVIAEASLRRILALTGPDAAKDKASVALAKELLKTLVNRHPKEKNLLSESLKTHLEQHWSESCSQVYKNLLALDTTKVPESKRKAETPASESVAAPPAKKKSKKE